MGRVTRCEVLLLSGLALRRLNHTAVEEANLWLFERDIDELAAGQEGAFGLFGLRSDLNTVRTRSVILNKEGGAEGAAHVSA